MLGPVELYPAAGPGTRKADQRGLDDGLVVDEVESVGLSTALWILPPSAGRIITMIYSFSMNTASHCRGLGRSAMRSVNGRG
jgi:hypothetical protein